MLSFYISHNGHQVGPWTFDQILQKIDQNELDGTSYLYDESQADWILLAEHPKFAQQFQDKLVAKEDESRTFVAPHNADGTSTAIRLAPEEPAKKQEWYVLKGENKYGPFEYLELVRMLQEKNLFEFDFVWNLKLAAWKRVAEVEDFSPDRIRELKDSGLPKVDEIFFRRRHARSSYNASVLIHNNKKVWRGQSLEISQGGAGILIENSAMEPGQTLFLHFKVGDDVPPFNATCIIVSKSISKEGESFTKYGVKFNNVSREVQQAIKKYTNKAA